MAHFNAQTARLAGLRSGEVRRAKPRRFKADLMPTPQPSQSAFPQQFEHLQERLEMLDDEIRHTRRILKGDDLQPRDRAQLLNSLDRLLERERILRGIPAPAPFKAERPRSRREAYDVQPIDVVPTKPTTYTGPTTGASQPLN